MSNWFICIRNPSDVSAGLMVCLFHANVLGRLAARRDAISLARNVAACKVSIVYGIVRRE